MAAEASPANGSSSLLSSAPASSECEDPSCREHVLSALQQESQARALVDEGIRGDVAALSRSVDSLKADVAAMATKLNGARTLLSVVVALATLAAQAAPHLPIVGQVLRAIGGALGAQ